MSSLSRKESVRNNAFSAAIWKVAERIGYAGVSLVVQVVLARLLTPADFGMIAIMVVFINLATVLVQSGLNTALVQEKSITAEDCSTVFWFSVMISAALYIVLFVSSPAIGAFYGVTALAAPLRALGILLFINAYNSIQVALLQRALRMREQLIATLIAAIISGTGGIVAACLGLGVWALVIQTLMQQVLTCVIMAFQIRWKPKFCFSLDSLARLFGFGWKLLFASLLNTFYTNLYDLVVGKAFSADALGYFSQGRKYPAQAESILDSAISSVTLPAAAQLKDSKEDVKLLMKRALQVSITLIAPVMLALCVTASPIVLIVFGEQWRPSIPIFMVFCVSAVLSPVTRINLQCFNAMGRSDVFLRLEIIKKIIAIAMIILASLSGNLMVLAYTTLAYGLFAVLINIRPSVALFSYSAMEQFGDIAFPLTSAAVSAGIAFIPSFFIDSNLILLALQPIILFTVFFSIGELTRAEPYVYTKRLLIATLRKASSSVRQASSRDVRK